MEEDDELTWARLKRVDLTKGVSDLAKDIYSIFCRSGEESELTANDVRKALAGAASDPDMRSAINELEERGILGHTAAAHNRFEYYLWPEHHEKNKKLEN